jgi:hypothetical protein
MEKACRLKQLRVFGETVGRLVTHASGNRKKLSLEVENS